MQRELDSKYNPTTGNSHDHLGKRNKIFSKKFCMKFRHSKFDALRMWDQIFNPWDRNLTLVFQNCLCPWGKPALHHLRENIDRCMMWYM